MMLILRQTIQIDKEQSARSFHQPSIRCVTEEILSGYTVEPSQFEGNIYNKSPPFPVLETFDTGANVLATGKDKSIC